MDGKRPILEDAMCETLRKQREGHEYDIKYHTEEAEKSRARLAETQRAEAAHTEFLVWKRDQAE